MDVNLGEVGMWIEAVNAWLMRADTVEEDRGGALVSLPRASAREIDLDRYGTSESRDGARGWRC